MCEIDWGAFATFSGVIVAIGIFLQWKKQKGSEVISLEAQNIFKNMDQIHYCLNIVLEDMLGMAIHNKVPADFPESRFNGFMTLNTELIKRLELIKFQNKDKETVRIINEFRENYKGIAVFYHQNGKIELGDMLASKELYLKSASELKNEMYKYSLYKK